MTPYVAPRAARERRRIRSVVCGTILLLGHSGLAYGDEIRADRSDTRLRPEGVERIYRGAVSLRDSAGTLSVSSDSALAWLAADRVNGAYRADRYQFIGGVSLRDEERLISADTLAYAPTLGEAVFSGRVRLEDAVRQLESGRVAYGLESGRVDAARSVALRYPADGVAVAADMLTYWAKSDSGVAVGGVSATRLHAHGGTDTLCVVSDTLHFAEKGERMRFVGEVRAIPAPGVSASCLEATNDAAEGGMWLRGQPNVVWAQGEGEDSLAIGAQLLFLGLRDSDLSMIAAYGNASLEMTAGVGSTREGRRVQADTCIADVEEGALTRVRATGQAEVSFSAGDSSCTSLFTRLLWMAFGDEGLDSLGLDDGGRVEHRRGGGILESRISGRRMLLRFADDRVEQALVWREATCERWGEDKQDHVYLSGDTLRLGFEGGRLTRAVGQGGISGRYVPEAQERGQ